MTAERVAVLRADDQRAGRAPTHCVRTGTPTERAVRIRSIALERGDVLQMVVGDLVAGLVALVLRRRGPLVVIAVSTEAWRRWRAALVVPVLVGAGGGGLVAVGVAGGRTPAVALGTSLVVAAVALRARAARHRWIGVRFRPARAEILVSRVSAAFDADARALFAAALRRR